MKLLTALLACLITMPIWFYLLHVILTAINANELTWFLYWVYIPVSLFVSVMSKHLESKK